MDQPAPEPEPSLVRDDEPPLHRAARLGDHAEIRRLVAAGADVNAAAPIEPPDCRECLATPLMVAAGSGDGASVETVRLLLELGADPTIAIPPNSAATFACEGLMQFWRPGGDAERLRTVLEAGAPLPPSVRRANELLCHTAAIGDPERLAVLLERGLSPNPYFDPVEAQRDYERMIESCRRRAPENPIDESGSGEALCDAMKQFDAEMIEKAGRAPSSLVIPLFRAAESGNAACIRLLLDAGADPAVRDDSKRTAMYCASSESAIAELRRSGLPIEDEDEYGWTPLGNALTDEAAVKRVAAFIAAGANVNATHDHGYTVFMSAVGSCRQPEIIRMLVAAGADPHAISDHGFNAFHAALDVNFEANAEESVRDTLGYLNELGVDIEHRNKTGLTPLAYAIEHGTALEVQVLCELGADPNVVCGRHECNAGSCGRVDLPLIFHAADGVGVSRDAKTESLLKAGADPNVTDAKGHRPLDHVLAAICSNAPDFETAYRGFFAGAHALRMPPGPPPADRESFVAAVMPIVLEFVERFASRIPVPSGSYEREWRAERVRAVALLYTYGGWWHSRATTG